MNIIVDTREPTLYDTLTRLIAENNATAIFSVESKPLVLGDISLEIRESNETIVLFERKSLSDLLSSIKDGRYAEQSHRLIHSSQMHTHNIVYIIEGMFSTLRTEVDRRMCLSAMTTLSYYKGFSVVRTCSLRETAEWIFAMSSKIQKERTKGNVPAFPNRIVENISNDSGITNTLDNSSLQTKPYCEVVRKVKKDNITPENIGEIILCTIPGISSASAVEIMKHYESFSHFMEEIQVRPESLENIFLTTNNKKRKLGKNIIENIVRFLGRTQKDSL